MKDGLAVNYKEMNDQSTPPLRFRVAPHIVQDLGLNLYTTLPRVLVEFVANAYDADSPDVSIEIDFAKIKAGREELKKQWEHEQIEEQYAKKAGSTDTPIGDAVSDSPTETAVDAARRMDLTERTLSEDIQIVVTDHGFGMSREDLADKFLIAGRRRREAENNVRTPKERLIMGRKGLGKLAGFGVARVVELITRKEGERHATKIRMDYDELIKKRVAEEIEVEEELLTDGGGVEPHGTKIILSKLVYGPLGSRTTTIAHEIGDNFALIKPEEFAIDLNKTPITPTPRDFDFVYPNPQLPQDQMVKYGYTTEEGKEVNYEYRIRFTLPSQQLNARERGVRVYAHDRLASAPDLLDLKTGIHGFNNTHYLDGIVQANFIDDDPAVDYIATDRQSLRWESNLLEQMRIHLSTEMENACKEYQKFRETDSKVKVRKDPFTRDLVNKAKLPKHKKNLAYRIAAALAAVSGNGLEDENYKTQLPIFVDGLIQGNILKTLADLAGSENPDFHRLAGQIIELTNNELGDFLRIVDGRLSAIDALKTICDNVDFQAANNEKELHDLLHKSPWLIDPTFTQFLISNETEETLNKKLYEELKVGNATPVDYDPTVPSEVNPLETNKRPDLVFLLANKGLKRLVIVELKAPNTMLHIDHLDQLKDYMRKAKEWLDLKGYTGYEVSGYLIGSLKPTTASDKVKKLKYAMDTEIAPKWQVFDIMHLLDRTQEAHQELWEVYSKSLLADDV